MAGAGKKRAQNERKKGRDDAEANKADSPKTTSTNYSPSSASANTTRGSPPSGFDGNRDPAAHSRAGSTSSPSIRSGAAVAVRHSGGGVVNKNIDLGAYGASLMSGIRDTRFPSRPPALNTTGREVTVKLNTFHVEHFPQKPIYQYDVMIGDGKAKRALIQKIWNSPPVTNHIGQGWVFDGNKIAWSMTRLKDEEWRCTVDMHEVDRAKENRSPPNPTSGKPRREDKHTITLRYTKQIDFGPLRAYLQGGADFTDGCLENISFLDHLMRETPSQKYTSIKRNFFARGNERFLLGGGIEAFKGVYASIRLAHGGLKLPARLSVNVDVANTAFWTESTVMQTAAQLCNAKDYHHLTGMLQNAKAESPAFRMLKRLRKLRVYTNHTGQRTEEAKSKPFIIKDFLAGQSAKTHKMKIQMPGSSHEETMTVMQYFEKRWKIRLQHPDLPVVQMTRTIQGTNIVFPMELVTVVENQRYPYKLSDKQTTRMIQFAVTLPRVRWGHIEDGLKMLNWGGDRYLANYGLQISPAPVVTKGRLLSNPKVTFAGGKNIDPRTSGRWDLRGVRFLRPFTKPLKSWGFCVIPGQFSVSPDQVRNFVNVFIKTLQGHGCQVERTDPAIIQGSQHPGECVQKLWEATGNKFQLRPEILFFIVPDKGSDVYKRIKKSADCRYGVVSQVLQSANVVKAQGQYCSNVAMKVNAKLGGVTAQSIGSKNWFPIPTMIIGADVSHGPPRIAGEEVVEPSVAALTMSFDREAIKYIAAVETNGYRVEMITKANFDDHLTKMVKLWMTRVSNGSLPKHVIYMRDGVSEGQYTQLLEQEVKDIRNVFTAIDPKNGPQIKITTLMGGKRHHVRMFPDAASGDKNSNPQPGTLIETGVTHPREFDFYLCAHSAIKGTARPVHYQVLTNEMNLDAPSVQNMIYDGSYQYVRSTTPVSLYPAAYYAHLAAARGSHHIDDNKLVRLTMSSQTPPLPSEIAPLLSMPDGGRISETMWFV